MAPSVPHCPPLSPPCRAFLFEWRVLVSWSFWREPVSQHGTVGSPSQPAASSLHLVDSGGDPLTKGMWGPRGECARPFRGSAFLGKVKIRKSRYISCHSVRVFVFTRILVTVSPPFCGMGGEVMIFRTEVICFHGSLCCWRAAALFVNSCRIMPEWKILLKQPLFIGSKKYFIFSNALQLRS